MSVKPKTNNVKSVYIRRQGGFNRDEWLAPVPVPATTEVQVKHPSAEEDGKLLAALHEQMSGDHQREFWTLGGASEVAKRAYLFRWGYLVHTGGAS